MMKYIKHSIHVFAAATLLAGCSKDADTSESGDLVPVTFSAGITSAVPPPQVCTSGGNAWTEEDRIGVFMLAAGGSVDGGVLTVGGTPADNRKYTVNPSNGALTAADGGALYYPQTEAVDFVAYYPHTSVTGSDPGQISGNLLHLTVGDQVSVDSQNALDVLRATTPGVRRTSQAVVLQFQHVLSKITLNITLGDGFTAADEVTAVSINGMPLNASLNLDDGTVQAGTNGNFPALQSASPSQGAAASFSALVVPQSVGVNGRTVVFTVGGQPYTWQIPNTQTFEAHSNYVFPITVKKNGITVGDVTIADWDINDHGGGEMLEVDFAQFITDQSFRRYCLENFDTNHDSRLSLSEVLAVEIISVPNKGISSLEGIKYFRKLQTLDCMNNLLIKLDVSGLENLQELFCDKNFFSSLDVSENTKLSSIHCGNGSYMELTVWTSMEHVLNVNLSVNTLNSAQNGFDPITQKGIAVNGVTVQDKQ